MVQLQRCAVALTGVMIAATGFAQVSAADVTVRTASRVTGLTASGTDVLYTTGSVPSCQQFVLWRTSSGEMVRLPHPAGDCGTNASGCRFGMAIGGGRALWLCALGTAPVQWRLYTASFAQRKPKLIRSIERRDIADTLQPIIVGRADETDLPYAVGDRVTSLAPDGKTRYTWVAPALGGRSQRSGRILALAAGFHHVAVEVQYENHETLRTFLSVFILSSRGLAVARYSDVSEAGFVQIRYAAPGLLIGFPSRGRPGLGFVPSKIVVRSRDGTRRFNDRRHGADLALVDFSRGVIAYQTQRQIRGIRYSDGKDVVLRTVHYQDIGHASLASGGLAYARNRSVSWAPWSSLEERFR